MKVAIQGFEGSYHALASEAYFKGEADLVMCASFPELFDSMKKEKAEYALMAIENTVAGTILPNDAMLRSSGLSIIGEIFIRIEHCLLALKGQTIQDISEVRSHPMALLQCRNFFSKYPHIKLTEDIDTAWVAQQIKEKSILGLGAIAGAYASKVFDVQILAQGIEDNDKNFTRFLILRDLSKHPEDTIKDPNKSAICFHIANEAGSLSSILNIFAAHNINLTKIQSLPVIGKEWEYFMHIDIEYQDLDQYHQALAGIRPKTIEFTVLGEYKKALI